MVPLRCNWNIGDIGGLGTVVAVTGIEEIYGELGMVVAVSVIEEV